MKKLIFILSIAFMAGSFCACSHNDSEGKNTRYHQEDGKADGQQHSKLSKEEREARRAEMEKRHKEREAKVNEAWAKFDQLSEQEKKEWVANAKRNIDRRDSIQAAKRAEMEAKWATFEKSDLAGQVELLKMRGVVYHEMRHPHGEHNHPHIHENQSKFPMTEYKK
ncbi:MAG: hypothetical protein J6Y78_07670 [Paludibacteraceae bacterium]|nr:hypothetical protein [Paludibacteraceae bacterium]